MRSRPETKRARRKSIRQWSRPGTWPATRSLRCEPLEDRRLLSAGVNNLLGIAAILGYPDITYDISSTSPRPAVSYTASTHQFALNATPLAIQTADGTAPLSITAPRSLQIQIQVDNSGNLIGGTPGDDLVVTGTIGAPYNYNGTLLTGEITQFGYYDDGTNSTTDQYDFRFFPTGGALLSSFFTGKDIGVATYSENSTFSGKWNVDFQGDAKGDIGPIPASPSIVTTASPASIILPAGPSGTVTLSDSAVLSGLNNPGGSITFTLSGPNGFSYTQTDTVSGNGTYPASTTLPISGTVVGAYAWSASYSGDTNNSPLTETGSATNGEQTVVSPASPTVATTASAAVTLPDSDSTPSVTLSDSAVLSGGYYPTGNIVFTLSGPNGFSYTQTDTVSGNGTYTASTTLPISGTVAGTYTWSASYSGDANNNLFTETGSATNGEQTVVSPASPAITTSAYVVTTTGTGEYATIGFWHNKNGQAVITNFDTGSTSMLLGNSLAANFANLFGYANPYTSATLGSAPGSAPGLAGRTNTQIAAVYENLWTPSGLQKNTYVQAFAVALGLYASGGGGTYNVGSNGSAFGVADNTTLSVGQILQTVSNNFNPTTGLFYDGDSTLTSEANNVLDGINSSGENPGPASVVTILNLNDSATLSGGYYEGGNVTFYLLPPGATPTPDGNGGYTNLIALAVYSDTVPVSGNGTYNTSAGNNPGGYVPLVTGTYEWVAVYSGDPNNNSVTSPFGAEPWTVGQASPTIITTVPNVTAVTLGAAPVTLTDTALLQDGVNPAGTITFTLVYNNTTVDTEAVTVNGNGSYTTPTGYTLPTSGTVTGAYQWNAVYSGDANNTGDSFFNDPTERVVISPASPALNTTPGGTVVIGGATISGTKYLDLTGNGFSADDTPQGGVTINLYQETNNTAGLQVGSGGDTLVASTTTASNGGYTFTVSSAGTYYVQETAPTGYVQTGGGPNGAAGNTYYKIVVANGYSYAGYDFDDYQVPPCTLTGVSYKVTTSCGSSQTVTSLAGNTHPGDTVTVTFTLPSGASDQVTLVSYIAPGPSFSDSTAYQQVIYQQASGNFSAGTHSLTVQIPNSYYQIDFVCGPAIDQLEPNQNGNAYGPDSANILYHAQNRFMSADNGGATAAVPTPSPISRSIPAPTSSSLTMPLTDSATLSGGYYETGTLTFYLFAPGVTPDATYSNNVYSDAVTVNGNGTYDTSMGTSPGGYLPTARGTHQWVVVYGGDGNNDSVTSPFGAEPWTVGQASPQIVTTPYVKTVTGGCGQFATIGFWHNKNGQAVITDFDSGAGSKLLGDSLASNYANLFGASNPYTSATLADFSATTLAGLTNTQVATVYEDLWTPSGVVKNTYVQAFAVALGLYASGGGGTYNVGSNGAAFGVANNTTLSVTQILQAVSNNFNSTTGQFYGGDQTLTSEANSVLDGINSSGENPCGSPCGSTVVSSGAMLMDSATLSGGYDETGTLTFYLMAPGSTASTPLSSAVYTDVVTVNGNGAYDTTMGNKPDGYLPTATGTYQWVVVYGGDSNNNGITSPFGAEPWTVGQASPTVITTMPNVTSVTLCTAPVTLKDTAYLTGGVNPTGTITFYLFGPGAVPISDGHGGYSNALDTESVVVNGNGSYTTPTGYTLTATSAIGVYQWDAAYSGDANNTGDSFFNDPSERVVVGGVPVHPGDYATIGFWKNKNGQCLIKQLNGSSTATALGNWLAGQYPHLYGSEVDSSNPFEKDLTNASNAAVASFYQSLFSSKGLNKTYAQIMATALGTYVTDADLAGGQYAKSFGFNMPSGGTGNDTYNVGWYGSALGLANNSSSTVSAILDATDQQAGAKTLVLSGVNPTFNRINSGGDVANGALTDAGLAYTPAQVRAAYGIDRLALDGTGQTIAVVDAYDNPAVFQSLDAFDSQFGLTDSGPTLYDQYGAAASFLTVLNQDGQAAPLPATTPGGPGIANWELETALDVEWLHAIAPGAKLVLVEANSQSSADLMTAAATAANQPGVSVVSMSWGFPEAQAVFAQDEALYDSTFTTPAGHQGVTFVASTGDYGSADPEYPAFSPNVVAVGGTSLYVQADNSYSTETGWGYFSDSLGTFIGTGGGASAYEPEPAYQQGVQSTGSRSTPDVSLLADPSTGAWIADTYNLSADNPFEAVGGTSLSAPCWAGLFALVNQGRAAAGQPTLNSTTPTDVHQALYSLPQSDFNAITSGNNGGYSAGAGYDMVTGLGTPVAGLLVPGLIAYDQSADVNTTTPIPVASFGQNSSGTVAGASTNALNVFDALTGMAHSTGDISLPARPAVGVSQIASSDRIIGTETFAVTPKLADPTLSAAYGSLSNRLTAAGANDAFFRTLGGAVQDAPRAGFGNSLDRGFGSAAALEPPSGDPALSEITIRDMLFGRIETGRTAATSFEDLLRGIADAPRPADPSHFDAALEAWRPDRPDGLDGWQEPVLSQGTDRAEFDPA